MSSSDAQTIRRVVWNAVYEDPEFIPDGSNWTTQAFPSLQWAIDVSSPGDLIFSKGSQTASTAIYRPQTTAGLQLTKSVGIYGGFPGESETEGVEDAEPSVYYTYLDGALGGVNYANHVVSIAAASPTLSGFTIRNGTTITPTGNDAHKGGGLYIYLSANSEAGNHRPLIKNCIISDNYAADQGGGAYVALTGTPTADAGAIFEDCTFSNNSARYGGGAVAVQTNLAPAVQAYDRTAFTRCRFVGNKINYQLTDYDCNKGTGAGMFICGNPVLTECEFIDNGPWNGYCNESVINGGGVAISNYVSATQNHTAEFHNCVFRGNRHSQIQQGCPSDARQDFIHHGGGVYIQRPDGVNPFLGTLVNDAEFYDCKFIDNVAANGGGAFLDRAVALFDGCEFMGNDANGRSAHVYDDADLNSSCDGYSGTQYYTQLVAAYGGGAISTYRLSYFKLIDCKFIRNTASLWSGGAIYVYQGATMDADRCYFVGNTAPSLLDEDPPYTNNGPGTGGAIWVNTECLNGLGGCAGSGITTEHAVSNVYNSLFVGNVAAGEGGALYIERAGRSTLVNCTIMFNEAAETGGVLSDSTERAEYGNERCVNELYNCIVWNNKDAADSDGLELRAQVFDELLEQTNPLPDPPADWPTVKYSCLRDNSDLEDDPYETPSFYNIESGDSEPLVPVTYSPADFGGTGWTNAAYDATTGTTEFTDPAANFSAMTNLVLRTRGPGDEVWAYAVIVSSSGNAMVVLGNLTAFSIGEYEVEDYRLQDEMGDCVDAGSEQYNLNPHDLRGNLRDCGEVDMGCYELTCTP